MRRVLSFPSTVVAGAEVSCIGVLPHGCGTSFFASLATNQARHQTFVDQLEEPSSRLGSPNVQQGDPTALYSFSVASSHPWHRHGGRRVFVGITGSAGAELRFSNAPATIASQDKALFLAHAERLRLPPDALFTVKFNGNIWHQFSGIHARHPAFFALSIHPDEREGLASEEQRELVAQGQPTIASLTEVLPFDVSAQDLANVPLSTLSMERDASKLRQKVCLTFRSQMGLALSLLSPRAGGYVSHVVPVEEKPQPWLTLLQEQLNNDGSADWHDDGFELRIRAGGASAEQLLKKALEGFVSSPPPSLVALQRLRNLLVTPLQLRRSPLPCPVSSLIAKDGKTRFHEFPVFALQQDKHAVQVVLGADDKHLQFRTAVGVRIDGDADFATLSMATRVRPRNSFGRFYARAVDLPHRKVVTPLLMQYAAMFISSKQ